MLTNFRTFMSDLWALTKPYWFSEERWSARGLLAVIIGMNLGLVYVNVLFNEWNNLFFNALQDKDYDAFLHQLLRFTVLAAIYIAIAVYQIYLNQMLQIHWRRWLTERYLGEWLGERTYYRLQLVDRSTDNPDQRISEDLQGVVSQSLNLTLGFIRSVVTLISFFGILWTLSGPLSVSLGGVAISIPGYMVWVALIYSIAGTWLAHRIGRPLVRLNFDQQRYEADFRFALVRLRENVEGIALYRGEPDETRTLRQRFGAVVRNWWGIMKCQKRLTWFSATYDQIATIFPILVASPQYFSGALQLGGLMQTSSAFGQVQGAMSWFIDSYARLADWKATVDRLITFHRAMVQTKQAAALVPQIAVAPSEQKTLALEGVEIRLPSGQPLLDRVHASFEPGERVLISGPSGSGKSTMFRAIAGIWPFGRGTIRIPAGARLLFLPQKPYLPLGSLREVVAYPAPVAAIGDGSIRQALHDCELSHLVDRLDEVQPWALALSPGEQQRIAVARALLQKPDWLFLDEATSALDEATEERLYGLLRARLPNTSLVSIGHRTTLVPFHDRRIEIVVDGGGSRIVSEPAARAAS